MLDADLAPLYGVPTRALIQAVRRNPERFPADFMFRLATTEAAALRSQTVISNVGRGGRRYLPYAFTEQGVAMLSSVLRSQRAIRVNVEIMRAFVRLRRMLVSHDELAQKVATLERRYDGQFKVVFEAIRKLMAPPVAPQGPVP
jgi:hypothetical protein